MFRFITRSFSPWEKAPGANWIGGWVFLRAGLDDMEKKKYLATANNRTPAIQTVARRQATLSYPSSHIIIHNV